MPWKLGLQKVLDSKYITKKNIYDYPCLIKNKPRVKDLGPDGTFQNQTTILLELTMVIYQEIAVTDFLLHQIQPLLEHLWL